MFLKSRKTPALAGAALLLTLPLAACGQSEPEPEPTASAESAEPQVAPPTILNAGALKVCFHTSAPLATLGEDGEPEGSTIDLIGAWGEELGLEVELVEYQFAGLIPALQAKQCDVLVGPFITPEREEVANFVPYLNVGAAVGVSPDNPAGISGYDDSLCGASVGVVSGAVINRELLDDMDAQCVQAGDPAIEITPVDTVEAGVQLVINNQMDGFFDADVVMGYYGKLTDGDIAQAGETVAQLPVGAGSLKDNAELHDALQTALDAMIEDGTYSEILEKWGISGASIA